jgi:hypothetical protein
MVKKPALCTALFASFLAARPVRAQPPPSPKPSSFMSSTLPFNFEDHPSFVYLDDVSVAGASTAPVPEPESYALLLAGLGAGQNVPVRYACRPE